MCGPPTPVGHGLLATAALGPRSLRLSLSSMQTPPRTPPSPSPAARRIDKRHHRHCPPLSFPPLFLLCKHGTSTPSSPSSLSPASCPRWTTGLPPLRHLRSATPFSPLSELHRVPIAIPFGPCLTSLVPSSSCRTPSPKIAGAPPPSKKHRRVTPSATSFVPDPLGEPRRHPSCPTTSPHHPRAHAADRATPRPPVTPRRPRRRGRGHRVMTTPGARARRAGWHGPAGPQCHWARPTVLGLGLESRLNPMR
jgi:hypothetical protein